MEKSGISFLTSKLAIAAVVLAVVFSSCVPQKKIKYLQNAELYGDTSKNYINERNFDYIVQPGDNLYIRVMSIEESNARLFNGSYTTNIAYGSGSSNSTGNAGIYLNGYTVDDNYEIQFPMAGKVNVKGLNVEQIREKLQTIIDSYLKQTTVYVKLGLFNLTVIGEVRNPGQYQIYQSDINLFQAIALAGNMTDFAKKDEVKIIRQTPDGSKVIKVNMLEADVLSSPTYYLKPNDVIVVDPVRLKQFGFTTFPYSTVISIISMSLTMFVTIRSIKNN